METQTAQILLHMYHHLFLVLFFKGVLSAHVQPKQVVAYAGGNVILPCSSISASDDIPTVEWSKKGLKPDVVYLYRDGCETFEMKNPEFEYRTNLIMREVKNGNVSLRISSVKPLDAGTYQCLRLWKNGTREATKVKLVVVAASDPKLAVISVDSRGVTVECEATCWLPPPLMMILDNKGNSLNDEEPEQHKTTVGCYSMKQTAILQSPISRVICRVYQQTIKQSKTAEILIPAHWMGSIINSIGITVFLTVVVCMLLFALCLCCRRNILDSSSACRKKPVTKKLSDQSLTSNTSESLLDQSAVHDGSEITETRINRQLKEEVKHLRSEKCQKDEIIRQQDELIRQKDETIHKLQDIRSQQCPACSQHDQATIPHSPTKSSLILRNRSSDFNTDSTNVPRDQNPKKVTVKSFPTQNGLKCESQKPTNVPVATHTPRNEQHNQSCPALTALASSASKSSPSSKKKLTKIDVLSKSDPNIQKVGLVQHRHPSELRSSFHSYNPYSPLADLPKNV